VRARRPVVALAICAVLLSPAAALGAAAAPSPAGTGTVPTAPLPKVAPVFDVQLWPEAAGAVVLVNVTVSTSTPLPVLVRMPLPAGATVDWVGEIVGSTPESDIASPYRLTDDGRIIEMVLTNSRVAQYEATYTQPTQEGDVLISTLEWTQATPASSVSFAVRAAASIRDVTVDPASQHAPQFNDAGDRLYVLEPRSMKVGETASIRATYRVGPETATAAPGQAGSRLDIVLATLAGLLVVAVAALLVVVRRQRRLRPRE
jgi:hypothetical protein